MKKFKYISGLLFAFVLYSSLIGCEDTSDGIITYYDDSSNVYINPNQKDQIAQDSAEYLTGKIAEKSSICGMNINIKKVFSIEEGSQNSMHPENSEIIIADIEVTNTTSKTVEVSAMSNFEISIDGSEPMPGMDLNTTLSAKQAISDYVDLNAKAEPNQTVSGYISFEVPENWESVVIKYFPKIEKVSYDEISYTITPDLLFWKKVSKKLLYRAYFSDNF